MVNAYSDFKYELAANTNKPKMLIDKFQRSVAVAVTVLYKEDPAACILHRDEPYSQTLREIPDFDRKYSTWSRFMCLDNDNYFNRGTDDKPRTIRGTISLASKGDIKKLVANCQTDLTPSIQG